MKLGEGIAEPKQSRKTCRNRQVASVSCMTAKDMKSILAIHCLPPCSTSEI